MAAWSLDDIAVKLQICQDILTTCFLSLDALLLVQDNSPEGSSVVNMICLPFKKREV